MPAISFRVTATDGAARRGRLTTPHGVIATPAFVPVGTLGAVKSLDGDDLRRLKAQVVLANAYHLWLRPGPRLIEQFGGLHKFMKWDGPLVTDSGGFQVFSLGFGLEHGVGKISNMFPGQRRASGVHGQSPALGSKKRLMRVDEDGVSFASHLDGTRHRLTAERSLEIQQQLGADLIFAFDECTSPLHDRDYTAAALARTHRWAERSLAAWTNRHRQALFGIVQGGAFRDLREQSARFIDGLGFPAYGIGGSLGKTKTDMHRILDWVTPLLDPAKPRHLLGIGEVADLIEGVRRGVDLFDCAAPSRQARTGGLYVSPRAGGRRRNRFRINLRAAKFGRDARPIDPTCACSTCATYSRAYLRHLYAARELTAFRLGTIHNLHFILNLMRELRTAITQRRLETVAKRWLSP